MHTRIISVNHAKAIQQASEILLAGGLVAFPTDTVYGLGCLVKNATAIDRLYQVKERSQSKAIAVLIAEITDLEMLTTSGTSIGSQPGGAFLAGGSHAYLSQTP